MSQRMIGSTVLVLTVLTLSACGSTGFQSSSESNVIVIGSQDYYSNEIVAEIYAQALEESGVSVDRQFRIGPREVYLPELESGSIDLFPEYTGPLLQYWKADTAARLSDEVYSELEQSAPVGLRLLESASATDENSYVVTKEFADQWNLTTIGDLKNVTEPLIFGSNSEAEGRPYGPAGLMETYGVKVDFMPIEDGGGPLTTKALIDGDIQIANIYTASPSIAQNNLVVLDDPQGLFIASHIVPLASKNVNDDTAAVINKVNAALSPEDLIALNVRSTEEELPASTIAADWLRDIN